MYILIVNFITTFQIKEVESYETVSYPACSGKDLWHHSTPWGFRGHNDLGSEFNNDQGLSCYMVIGLVYDVVPTDLDSPHGHVRAYKIQYRLDCLTTVSNSQSLVHRKDLSAQTWFICDLLSRHVFKKLDSASSGLPSAKFQYISILYKKVFILFIMLDIRIWISIIVNTKCYTYIKRMSCWTVDKNGQKRMCPKEFVWLDELEEHIKRSLCGHAIFRWIKQYIKTLFH